MPSMNPTTTPPQLTLSINHSSSFKRSFNQFGFDELDSPGPNVDADNEPTDNRRKRPRSASSLSEREGSSSSSNSASSAPRRHLLLDLGIGRGLESSVALGLGMASHHEPPPRLPTPQLLDSDDVEMPDVAAIDSPSPAEHVRRSVDRFNTFERHISVLRSSSPPVIPLPAELTARHSPPTLPPLPLVDLTLHPEGDDETAPSGSTPPRLDLNLPPTSLSSHPSSPPPHVLTHEAAQFRERLDSAIDGLGTGDLHFEVPISEQQTVPSSSTSRPRSVATAPLFDWSSSPLDLDGPEQDDQPSESPPPSLWRHRVLHQPQVTAATDRTIAGIRRFAGTRPSPPRRLYPRPASLAAPLSIPSSADASPLDLDVAETFLDFHRTEAMEHALDRARTLQRERQQERQREREREEQFEREREEESERDIDHSWSLDTFWGNSSGRRTWEQIIRPRRETEASENMDVEQPRPGVGRTRRREERSGPGPSAPARAARFLDNGVANQREAESSSTARDRRSRYAYDAPSRQAPEPEIEEFLSRVRARGNPLRSTEANEDWLGSDDIDWLAEPSPRGASYRNQPSIEDRDTNHGASARSGTWQPGLALSPPSTVQPTRTTAHARAQSIPNSTTNSTPTYQSLHQLRTRISGPLRVAGVGSSNSLVAESVAARRRSEARMELMEQMNRSRREPDSDSDSDWEHDFNGLARRSRHTLEPEDEVDMPDLGYLRASARRRLPRLEPSSRNERVPFIPTPLPLRLPPPRHNSGDAEEESLNSRQAHYRRPIPHLRQHSAGGEPTVASSGVDRRHVSWEASRDPAVSSTYEYLSALSHGFDSHTLSLSDLAQTITSNSAANPPRPHLPHSPPSWDETDVPFSTLFGRSSSISTNTHAGSREVPRRHSSGSFRSSADAPAPSLPHPDLGGDFEQTEDMLRSTNVDADSPDSPTRPPSPPPATNSYTGPFRSTMQRRDEYSRRALRRIPDPPSIPPLHFGGDFEDDSTMSGLPERQETRHRLLVDRSLTMRDGRAAATRRWVGPPSRSELSPVNSSRLADAERRLLNYMGPSGDSQARRPFPPRAAAPPPPHREPPRYSAADMHNVLARQARLEGSRLDLPSAFGGSEQDSNPLNLNHTGTSSMSRAQRLISQFHEQLETVESSTTTSSWAALPRRAEGPHRGDIEARRRRFLGRSALLDEEGRPRPFRESLRGHTSPSSPFHVMGMLRRRALGDYVRDEDFDTSYESLLSLSGLIGDARPKGTSEDVLSGLESAQYRDWATSDSDKRCPICLDDYQPSDRVMRLGDCRHWLHKDCLAQWLKGATTCPVCRKDVKGKARRHAHGHPFRPHRRDSEGPGGGGGGSGGRSGGDVPHSWLDFLRD